MNSRLKIGLISYRSNPYCGGQGVYVRCLGAALADLGHDVHVIAGPPDPLLTGKATLSMLGTLDLYNPEALFRTPSLRELSDPINLLEWLDVCAMGYPEPLTFGMRVKRYLAQRGQEFDILHDNQSLSYGIQSLSRRMPVVATIHHPMTVDRKLAVRDAASFFGKLKALRWYSFIGMQKRVARTLPALLTVSDSSKQDIAAAYGIQQSRFRTIPIGIDLESFYPIDTIRKDPTRIIVTNSADTPLKGLAYLLSALCMVRRRRNMSLIVIGEPKKGGIIEKMVRELRLTDCVTFTGRISQDLFVREYARAGMAVVPSLYEGFGLPVGEAMACRVPVICTTGGALPEVAGDAARLVPPANVEALAEAILEMADDQNLRETLAEKGYQRVLKEFTWRRCAEKTAAVYQEVIRDYHQV